LIFSKNVAWNISLPEKNSPRYLVCTNVFIWSTCHSFQIVIELNFRDRFSKNIPISNFTKIRLVGAELFHAGRQTWRSYFANASKSYHSVIPRKMTCAFEMV
jgi:hypothetical protein